MAEVGLREVVNDPLALNPYQQAPQRDLPLRGVRNPRQTGGDDVYENQQQAMRALGQLGASIAGVQQQAQDEAITEGKLMYMQGRTEADLAATGNKWNIQGWQALSAADKANRWYADQINDLANGRDQMDPTEYGSYVLEQRSTFMNNLPDDPAIRKLYVAQFEDLGPRLVQRQALAHNDFNQKQSEYAFGNFLSSGSFTNADAPRKLPDTPLDMSEGIVREQVAYNDDDLDAMTRALMGEAGGEGTQGMAAVAHVIVNRTLDGRYGGRTIKGVVMEPGQFSSFNGKTGYAGGAGGVTAVDASDKSRAYQAARQIALDVLSGHNVDPTNGSTHFYSPAGMALLVKQGKQTNLVPTWWENVAASGSVTLGGHKFAGKYRTSQDMPITLDPQTGEVQTTADVAPAGATGGDVVQAEQANPQLVAEAQGIPNADTPSVPQTQIQDTIRHYNMPPDIKAAIVAQEVITQLDGGSSNLWDNIGGTAFLRELGATPQQIRMVENSYERYQKEQANKFTIERASQEDNLLTKVENGDLTVEEAGKVVQDLYSGQQLSDQGAYSLMTRVFAARDKRDAGTGDLVQNPELLRALSNVYQSIRNDPSTYTAEWGQQKIEALADQFKVPKKQLEARISEAWTTERAARDSIETRVAAANEKRQKLELKMDEVRTAVAIGRGLNNITGDIGGLNAQQWGVNLMRKDLILKHTKDMQQWTLPVTEGGLGLSDEEAQRKAAAGVDADLWQALYKQGSVVDEETAEAMTAGASGAIVGTKGEVSEGALEAFDVYLRMKRTPNVGAGYAAKYLYNEDARNLLMNAERLSLGGFDPETALRQAYMFTKDGLGDPPDVKTTDNFRGRLYDATRDNFDKLMGQPGWMYPSGVSTGDADYARLHQDQLRSAVANRAWAYYAVEPQNDPSVIIKKAAEDVANEGSIVGGNILLPQRKGNSVRDQMGLSDYTNDTPAKAIDMYLKDYAELAIKAYTADDKSDIPLYAFGDAWRTRAQGLLDYGMSRVPSAAVRGPMGATNPFAGFQQDVQGPTGAPYYARWDDISGTITIQLWEGADRKNTVDPAKVPPLILRLDEVGAWYKKKIKADEATSMQELWKGLW